MPFFGPRWPIQRTSVPTNPKVASAPAVADTAAAPPLHAGELVSAAVHVPLNTAAVSSNRVPTGGKAEPGRTSKASTTTAQSTELSFLRPVDSTAIVCAPGV